MRSVRGNRYGGAPGVRPNPRLGVGLALTFAVVNACGGRTLELQGDPAEGEAADGGVGGVGARTGAGGSQGGVGGGNVGGTGVGGSVSSGGGPSPGARGGGTSTGGTAGVAGTQTGGTGMVGGRGGGSSVGGTSPGKGGGGGRPGMPPDRGAGGGAGAPGSGGAAGTAGAGGAVGSPQVYEACQRACANIPSACNVGPELACADSCDELSLAYDGCRLELTDYIDCVADRLHPDAMCAVSSDGACVGEGCTTNAIELCAPLLQIADECTAGCATSFGMTPDGCEFARVCSTHWVGSSCKTDTSGQWLCTCAVDGAIGASVVLRGDASAACTSAADFCDFAR